MLLKTRSAALAAHRRALESGVLVPVVTPELDIVAFAPAVRTAASTVSQRSEAIFAACASDPTEPLHLAKWRVPKAFGALAMPDVEWDRDGCTVIRSVLMKPEHAGRASSIVDRIAAWPRMAV